MDDDTTSFQPKEQHLENTPSIDAPEPMESSAAATVSAQEDTIPSKRQLPDNEPDSQHEDPSQSSSIQPTQSQDEHGAGAESPGNSSKRRRISFPGRSILKTAPQDEEQDPTGTQDITGDQTHSADATDNFSSTADFRRRNRKSIGRRVSFATTARIRMFDRDEKENDFPKTTSFLEGLKGNIALDPLFTFGATDDNVDNTQDTFGSASSVDMERLGTESLDGLTTEPMERTGTSTESSDSEKERSFEVNIDSGNTDSTASSARGSSVFAHTDTLSSQDSTPFDGGDADNNSSSEDDSNFFPDINAEKAPSSIGMFEAERDGILGPQVHTGHTMADADLQEAQGQDDGTQDMSMVSEDYSMSFSYQNYNASFLKARSSLTGENPNLGEGIAGSQQHTLAMQAVVTDSQASSILSLTDSHLGDHLGIKTIFDQDLTGNLTMSDRFAGDGDTADMDITAPIGVGIHEIAQEQPPTGFPHVDDNTARFSEMGTPMDLTLPIGSGIRDITEEQQPAGFSQTDDNTGMFSDLGTPMDMTQPIGAGILESHASTTEKDSAVPETEDKLDTPFASVMQPINHDNTTNEHNNDNDNENKDRGGEEQHNQQPMPSTPPRRESSIHTDSSSPIMIPRRSLGAPGRFTPTVKARLNIFPEVLERQLQTLESSSSTAPVFRASHVSPETSNLAKRIYRYSVGAPSRTSEQFQARLNEERDDTMDMDVEEETTGSFHKFSNAPVAFDSEQAEKTAKNQEERSQETSPEVTSASEGDDDTEMQPISLSKFLNMVGITFLDHLNASTRRRTIPSTELDSSSESCRREDFVKAKAIYMQEMDSYRDACGLLKESTESSRAFSADQERKVLKKNPQYFVEYRVSDLESKEFMKERLKLIKVHSKLVTNADFTSWKSEVLERQQESLEHHLGKLKEDIARLRHIGSGLAREKTKATPRSEELRRLKEDADERHRSYEQCDKEQLAHLAEAVEEQGAQIDHYNLVREKREKELAELRARVEQLKMKEQATKKRITVAEKTIQDYQYVRPEDVAKAKQLLSIVQATHRWEPVKRISSLATGGGVLEFVYDKTLRVSIDVAKVGRVANAVLVSEYEGTESVMDFELSLKESRVSVSALTSRKRRPIKEYLGLLRDYTTMIAANYKQGTAISKILRDISQFWSKVCLIRNEVELARAHHVVDLVAGSEENQRELESNGVSKPKQQRVAGSTPVVLLDIRVRFTGSPEGMRHSVRRNSERNDEKNRSANGGGAASEPVKFYLWFTFTLNDILNFPGPDSFAWRIEFVYGDISQDRIVQAVGPTVKKGGYGVLRDTCVKVHQLLRT
ncbi:hypothetical protein BGZ70_006606 [Mortierella alpina]|uniref:Spc7 kinetochore protein domain-containing protein n=1 Tax=Mortierella alpina TaxID=64518 RepID=A0A9P6J7W9_MORAP|nr:hypothetical protein BGZ70_006606 [Mortierella alpina]